MPATTTHVRRRAVVLSLFAVLAVVLLVVLRGSGTDYRVHAQFLNAGQLVRGGLVQVGGQTIGKVEKISLTPAGHADVELKITEERFAPLRKGTRLAIRSVGQATITNRYVDVAPGPDNAAPLPDGAVFPASETQGIVDLDEIFNALEPDVRSEMRGLIANVDAVYAGSSAPVFNRMLAKLRPSMAAVADLTTELGQDGEQIERLITAGSRAATAVASRGADLEGAVVNADRTFAQLSRSRQDLDEILRRAPSMLRSTSTTLDQAARTAADIRPMLRAVPASQPALRGLLRDLPPALGRATPTLDNLSAVLPDAQTALKRFAKLRKPATEALRAVSAASRDGQPVFEALRIYSADLLLGVVNGLTGLGGGAYNETGHYFRAEFVQSPQTIVGGAFGDLLPDLTGKNGLIPGVLGTITRQTKRCPGSGEPPAPDGSSPWIPKPGICDPSQNMSPLVNSPSAFCRTAIDCDESVGTRRKRTAREARATRKERVR